MSRIIDALAKVEDVNVRTQFDGKYQVAFEDGWMREGHAKIGIYGVGDTVEEAAMDYLRKIGGHRIVCEMRDSDIKCEYIIIEVKAKNTHKNEERADGERREECG